MSNLIGSIGFTISVSKEIGGISALPNFEEKILKKIGSYEFHHAVAEKEGVSRHLHFQLWLSDPKRIGDVKKAFTRICEKEEWWDVAHKINCIKARSCYNDWYDGYCSGNEEKSNDFTEILLSNVPPITSIYYPTDAEQQAIMDKSNAVDKNMFHLETLWNDWKLSRPSLKLSDKEEVAFFLSDMMFSSRKIRVIQDAKKRKELCVSLHAYINKVVNCKLFLTNEDYEIYCMKQEMSNV